MTPLGVDTSHYQPLPDFGAWRAGGQLFNFAKCTEGTSFYDPNYGASRHGTDAVGGLFGGYHFARPGDPVQQANFFCDHAALGPGEVPILDLEDQALAGAGTVNWTLAWVNQVKARYNGTAALLYLNQWWRDHFDWRPLVQANSGLWLAQYDGNPDGGGSGAWPAVAFKQYSDRGRAPGFGVTLDVDSFNGDEAAARKYGIQGAPPPPPPPPVVQHPDVYAWNLPNGWYYGNLNGPRNCIGANYANGRYTANAFVKNIQQWAVFHGCADGVRAADWRTTGWCDGLWQRETDTAIANWHQRFYGGQPQPTQVWSDDYRRLAQL